MPLFLSTSFNLPWHLPFQVTESSATVAARGREVIVVPPKESKRLSRQPKRMLNS